MSDLRIIYVYKDWDTAVPEKIGTIYIESSKGREVISFEYDDVWLGNMDRSLIFDPDLMLYKGRQYAPLDKSMFGVFADSCPDRWGRLLMKRREVINAKKEKRKPKRLTDVDFLLGVYDETRMGGLRFAVIEDGPFLSDDKELATPPWTTLRKLESASLAFEKNEDGMEEKWLKQLLAPGSSLGGARPKASVSAPDGSLWIAKFPSKHDDIDVSAWEMVVHDLAINLIDFQLALDVAPTFGLTAKQANIQLNEIKNIVKNNWRMLAKSHGLNRSEIERMEPAFNMEYK